MNITVLSGPPGSGKSTIAEEILKRDGNTVRVNRDDLRAMCHRGLPWTGAREKTIANIEREIVTSALLEGKSVVVDNTHLRAGSVEHWKDVAREFSVANTKTVEVRHIDMMRDHGVTLEQCIRRDELRLGNACVGRGVIDRMMLQTKRLDLSTFDKVAVVDIDGTLSNLDHRLDCLTSTPKDYVRFFRDVDMDGVFESVWHSVLGLKASGHTIIVLSGRSNICGYATNEWLNAGQYTTEHLPAIQPTFLFMRQSSDHRPDDQVKRQLMTWMFECGLRKDAIKVVLDDRDSVCAVWRELELPLIQVDRGIAIAVAENAPSPESIGLCRGEWK